MNLLEKKNIRVLSISLIFVFFSYLILRALRRGGRWDLNEQIAFSDRLISGFASYSNGITDLFFPTSPYFPGVGYLSYFYQLIGFDNLYVNNQLMLLTAVMVGFLYFILLKKLTLKLYTSIPNIVVSIVLIILYATHFRQYMDYMIEFKPDTILLIVATIGFFLLENNKKPKIANLIYLGIMLFIATFFKQSFFILYFYVFILLLLNKYFSLKEKIIIIVSYGIIGIIALYLIFDISNLYYFSVEIMGQHPMLSIRSIVNHFGSGLINNGIFLILILLFAVMRYRSFPVNNLESKYFIFALLWFVFSAISTAKLGGNVGNFEAGIIVFIPFAIFTLDHFFKKYYSKKNFFVFTSISLIVGIVSYSYLTVIEFGNLNVKINDDKASIEFLSENFNNKTAFVDGNTFIIAKMSNLKVLTEIETMGHFNNVPGYDFHRIIKAISLKKYDLFLINNEFSEEFSWLSDKNIEKEIYKTYKFYENSTLPEQLKGRILVPKNK